MSSIDLLFWLLVVLMGGIAWAVEAGLGQRHRKALASCVVASIASGVVIMFWVEDNTKIEYAKRGPVEKKKRNTGAKGGLEQEGELVPGGADGSAAGGSQTGGPAGEGAGGAGANGSPNGPATAQGAAMKPQGGATVVGAAMNPQGGSPNGSGQAAEEQLKPENPIEEALLDEDRDFYVKTPFKDCEHCPDLVILPAGNFQSGSPLDEPGRDKNEWQQKESTIDRPFAIGRLEISRTEFREFVQATGFRASAQCTQPRQRGKFDWTRPGFEQDYRHPVTCITAEDVKEYIAWIARVTGREYRLPSELEWEYAARAGTSTAYWTGKNITKWQANFGRTRDGTVPGGSIEMNAFGIADMAGNLWELTSDCSRRADVKVDASPEEARCERILKGGAWDSAAAQIRHAARSILLDGNATNTVGFRVMRPVDGRDQNKLLSIDQRRDMVKEERRAAELKRKEIEAAEKAKLEAREAAAKAAADAEAAKAAAAAAAATPAATPASSTPAAAPAAAPAAKK